MSKRYVVRGRLYVRDLKRWWKRYDRTYGWKWRTANCVVALVVLLGAIGPGLGDLIGASRYMLTADALQLVGKVDPGLTSLLSYDGQNATYEFNKNAIKSNDTNPLDTMKSQVGTAQGKGEDKSTYALSVPANFGKGVTYTDINSSLSFTMTPQFGAMDGKLQQDRLVFPMSGGAQAVYTLKNNGLKEDILVDNPSSDTMTFSYDFKLPKTLAVKYIPDSGGAVGVYAADPSLYGNITYGNDSDRQAVEKARESAAKDYLVFGLPAPIIKDTKGRRVASAHFELQGTTLKVIAEGLKQTKGPITIDPSVVVTSASDFQTGGNDEGMIDFGTSGQISRGGLTGGSVGSWSTTSSLTNSVEKGSSAVYGGYIYQFGGYLRGAGTFYSTSSYAPINSNGTIGAWSTTTSLPYTYQYHQTVAYNGYMYLLGGTKTASSVVTAEVFVAPINSNGTLGSWTATTSLPATSSGGAVAVYNGYIYYFGGSSNNNPPGCNGSSTCLSTAYYASLSATGAVGNWTALGALSVQRAYGSAIAYNGYMYLLGGIQNTGLIPTTNAVQYAPINSDGTLGSWVSTNSFASARYAMGAYVYNGYLYIATGYNSKSDVQYAQVNANGSVGTWRTTTAMSTGLTYATGVAWGGYLYLMNGYDATSDHADVWYTKIDPAGQTSAFGTLTNNFTTARAISCSVAYNGYLYAIGGSTADTSGSNVTTVQYTSLNTSTGNNGAWSTTTLLPTARGSAGCTAHNGYLYVVGGSTGTGGVGTASSAVLYIAINSNGTLAASWTTSGNSLPNTYPTSPAVFTYGTSGGAYLYVLGGCGSSGGTTCDDTNYAALNTSTGAVGTWTTSGNAMVNKYNARGYAQVGKYLYAFAGDSGGSAASSAEYTSINNDGTINAWASTTSMNTAIRFTNGTTVNGCIYSVGGENAGGTSMNNVQYACPAANGTISAWYNASSLTVATTDLGVTSYNSYIYGVGGYTTGVQTTTQYALVNNGGSGNIDTWTLASNGLAASGGRTNLAATMYNGYIYASGGSGTSSYMNTVEYSAVGADGSPGTFTTDGYTFSNGRDNGALVAWGGYLYLLGGNNFSTAFGDTQYAPIGSSGNLSGNWATTTSFVTGTSGDTGRTGVCAVAWGGYLYALGGNDPVNTNHGDVRYAPINSNGTVGAWADSGNNFTNGRTRARCFAANGYLYILGGSTTVGGVYNDVQYAPINSNGTLGAWTYTSSFPKARGAPVVAYANGFVYIVGGAQTTSYNSGYGDTLFAPVSANGTLGPWQISSTVLPSSRTSYAAAGVVYNGRIYLTGGSGGASSNDVYYAPLSSTARTARYSKLIDLGVSTNLSSITYSGVLPTSSVTPGVTPISFRAAGSDGVFGSVTSSSSITPGVASCLASNQNYKRYLLVTITLDDANSAILADASGTLANVTDLTVNYTPVHPPPNIRLRHGQTLQQGNLSALDTCTVP